MVHVESKEPLTNLFVNSNSTAKMLFALLFRSTSVGNDNTGHKYLIKRSREG